MKSIIAEVMLRNFFSHKMGIILSTYVLPKNINEQRCACQDFFKNK